MFGGSRRKGRGWDGERWKWGDNGTRLESAAFKAGQAHTGGGGIDIDVFSDCMVVDL